MWLGEEGGLVGWEVVRFGFGVGLWSGVRGGGRGRVGVVAREGE